jgi:mannose-6-phosphate isomerase-like protein (cupin superfamily)
MKVAIGELDPGIHYTLDYHIQPEVYYVIVGRGIICAAVSAIEVTLGSLSRFEVR